MNAIDPTIHIAAANIRLDGVSKSYGSVTIIPKLDVEFREGEFTVVLGPSGCGKSTLMQMIAGLERVSGGKIVIGDREVQGLEPRERGCAMVSRTMRSIRTCRSSTTSPIVLRSPAFPRLNGVPASMSSPRCSA